MKITSGGRPSHFGLAPLLKWRAVLLPGSKQFCENVVQASRKKRLVQASRNRWDSSFFPGFTIKLSGLLKRRGGLMRLCSMDFETPSPRDTGRIWRIGKATERNEGQRTC